MIELGVFIVGLTQIMKMAGFPKKLLPLLAVLIGAIINPILKGAFEPLYVLEGMFVSLTATGIINRIDEGKKKKKAV